MGPGAPSLVVLVSTWHSIKRSRSIAGLSRRCKGEPEPPICFYSWVTDMCFSSDDVDKYGLHSWRCCIQVSTDLSQDSTYFRERQFMKKQRVPEKKLLWVIWGPMQLLNRWWGYILGCQRKTCDPPWGRMMDSWKTGWMSREHLRYEGLYDALPVQFAQERAAISFVISGPWHLLGGFSRCTLWSSFLWKLIFGLCRLCQELVVHFFAMIHQVFI